MAKTTNYLPKGARSVTPHLVLKNTAKAIEFYKKVFGAEELHLYPMPDGRIMHASVQIGDSRIFFSDEMPERGLGYASAETSKNSNVTIHLYVPDVDELYQKALDAGAKGELPPMDGFWGDRYARIVDPFGQPWSFGMLIEELTPEEIQKRGAECMKKMATVK